MSFQLKITDPINGNLQVVKSKENLHCVMIVCPCFYLYLGTLGSLVSVLVMITSWAEEKILKAFKSWMLGKETQFNVLGNKFGQGTCLVRSGN